MTRALQTGRESGDTHTRIGLTQIGRGRIESHGHAAVGHRSRVAILQQSIRRKVQIGGTERPEGIDAAHELDGLKLATEVQLQ